MPDLAPGMRWILNHASILLQMIQDFAPIMPQPRFSWLYQITESKLFNNLNVFSVQITWE